MTTDPQCEFSYSIDLSGSASSPGASSGDDDAGANTILPALGRQVNITGQASSTTVVFASTFGLAYLGVEATTAVLMLFAATVAAAMLQFRHTP
ncbi:hypothetical protein LO763_22355 [Glycomyces sp. A-F 0318]|uniref:hypothetical protein n=1 Tax=Glycomyces amatae TaxID=2881355 RepID=UPI001E29B62F|nr:hypothetical protein [Glycomyces amatae]MCD0446361.1 hypothetical protein [Glycomyces amatae]